jgi:hypothetical protein
LNLNNIKFLEFTAKKPSKPRMLRAFGIKDKDFLTGFYVEFSLRRFCRILHAGFDGEQRHTQG